MHQITGQTFNSESAGAHSHTISYSNSTGGDATSTTGRSHESSTNTSDGVYSTN